MVVESMTRDVFAPNRATTRAEGATWYRSPRLPLLLIVLMAAVINFWQLDQLGYSNTYYAAAVKSMLLNWHNFFFNAFDPAGFVTIDKPPLGFWFQVLSAKIFGYNGVSLLLPQALAAVGSVAVLNHLVGRVFGRPAGLLAAFFLALTPVLVASSRSNIIDTTLVFFLLLGAWAVSKAAETGKLRWLLLTAVLVGIGFNIKMMEAYLVVPAFGALYVLGSPLRWRTRFGHLALATVVLLAVSFSWATAVDLTPASQRPWVDSTQTNSELDLAIGYNGIQRLLGMQGGGPGGPQAATSTGLRSGTSTTRLAHTSTSLLSNTSTSRLTLGTSTGTTASQGNAAAQAPGQGGGGPGGLFDNGAVGPFRLFNGTLGGQASWLLPLALLGIVAVFSRRVRFPLNRQQGAALLWGIWLLTEAVFFSVAGFFHSYYLVTLAPAVAALAAIALVTLYRDFRSTESPWWRAYALPLALVLTAAGQIAILSNFSTWSSWITPPLVVLTLIGAGGLVLLRLKGSMPVRSLLIVLTLGVGGLMIAPSAWAVDTMNNHNNSLTPSAGPSATSGRFGGFPGGPNGAGGFPGGPGTGGFPGATGGPNTGGSSTSNTAPSNGTTAPLFGTAGSTIAPSSAITSTATTTRAQRLARLGGGGFGGFGGGDTVNKNVLNYLLQHQGTTKYLLVTDNSMSAAMYIIQTDKPVMSLGGFSGSDPILTLAQLQSLIKNNTVRYFMLGGGGPGGSDTISTYVQSACSAVPSSAISGSSASSTGGFGSSLYDCGALTTTKE